MGGGLNLEAIEGWKRWFDNRIKGVDIFDIAEAAILVAALYRPYEFFQRRDTIAQALFSMQKPNPDSYLNEEDHVLLEDDDDDDQLSPSVVSSDDDDYYYVGNIGYGTEAEQVDDDEVPLLEEPSMDKRACGAVNEIENKDNDDDVVVVGGGGGGGDCTTQTKPRHIIKIKLKRNKDRQAQEEEEQVVNKGTSSTDKVGVAAVMKSKTVESPNKIRTTDEYCCKVGGDEDDDGKGKEQVKKNTRDVKAATISSDKVHHKPVIVALNANKESHKEKKNNCKISDGGEKVHQKPVVALNANAESHKEKKNNCKISDGGEKVHQKPVVALNANAESHKEKKNNCKISDGGAKGVVEGKTTMRLNEEELKFEASKRKFVQECKDYQSSRKKIKMIDFNDLPLPQKKQQQQQEKVGFGCRNKLRGKPWQQQQQQNFPRTIV